MTSIHTIRLRGPWQLEPLARFIAQPDGTYIAKQDDVPPQARATMPGDWSASFGGEFLGRVRYRRTFQKPTGLGFGQRVILVVEPPQSLGVVRLGDEELGEARHGGPPGRFDVTDRLLDRNLLEIIVEHPARGDAGVSSPGGLIGEVRLEIEDC